MLIFFLMIANQQIFQDQFIFRNQLNIKIFIISLFMNLDFQNCSTSSPLHCNQSNHDFFSSFFLENQNQYQCNPKIYQFFPEDKIQQNDYPLSIISCNGDHSDIIQESIPKMKKTTKISKISKTQKYPPQNPHRNIYTNIGNQILSFICVRKKSNTILKRFLPNMTVQEEDNYYQFALKLKKTINGYINQTKLKKIWYAQNLSRDQTKYLSLVRKLSLHYLQNMIIQAMLTSKKLNKKILEAHFSVRRILLETLLNFKE